MGILKSLSEKSTAPLIQRLWHEYISKYKRAIFFGLFCMGVSAFMTAALAKLLQPLFDDVFFSKDENMLWVVAAVVFTVFVLKGLSSFGDSMSMVYVGQHIISDIQKRLFSHLLDADLAYFHARSSGELVSRFTNDVNMMRSAVTNSLTSLGKDTLSLIFLVVLMFYQDFLLASLAFFVFPAAILPIVKIGKKMRKVSSNTQVEMGTFNILLSQVFQGVRIVKSYAMESYERGRANEIIDTLCTLIIKSGRTRAASHPIMETLGGIAIVTVIIYGGLQVIHGDRTTGTFISFITALLLAYEPLKRIANLNANLQEGLAAAVRVFETLDTKPSLKDKKDAQLLLVSKGNIEISNVNFTYPSGKKALHNIQLKIPGGKRVALVGPSGGGKSTLMNMLPRFYDVSEGRIAIDGLDIRDVTLGSLRSQIALVSQEVILFDDTVRANIAYGRMGAKDDDIIKAAKLAAAHDFIMSLPEGYDTIVGEQGIRLSGGQRQRLSIARAMLKNAPILLLDEATSALDTESERQVQAALNRLMEGRTTLVIAHRLSTVMDADAIYVIEDGKITESGKHEDLMANKKTYARLVEMQFSNEINPVATQIS